MGTARFSAFLLSAFVLFAISFGSIAQAQDYVSGHGALELWNDEARVGVPAWVRIWLRFMQISFLIGLVFVWRHVEARWAVGGFFAVFLAAVVSQQVFDIEPLSGLIALFHVVFWTPALYVLITRRPFSQGFSAYSIWSGVIAFVIVFSFIFDIPYTLIYLDHILGLGWLF